MNESIQIATAFGAGLLTFFSPCILPLIPAYICFITGLSSEELAQSPSGWQTKRKVVITEAILFILGFSFVFIALGASASLLGSFFSSHRQILRNVGAAVLIIFGLYIMGVLKIGILGKEKRMRVSSKPATILGSFIVGIAFGLGWTPCVGPILGGILTVAATEGTVIKGVVLLSAYSLGLAIPLLFVSVAIKQAMRLFSRIRKHFKLIKILSGILLIGVGIGMIF